MPVAPNNFFRHIDDFFNYRQDIYEISPQTVKSNRVDLDLFKNFICSQNLKTIDGPAVIDFQYYLKNQRQNCGASINRKIFTLRSYGNFLKLYDLNNSDKLPFYDVLKIRQGYRKRPSTLTPRQIKFLGFLGKSIHNPAFCRSVAQSGMVPAFICHLGGPLCPTKNGTAQKPPWKALYN